MLILLLRKSVKSIQINLNELLHLGRLEDTVSASAYTKARQKFKHTAFIELSQDILDAFDKSERIERWKGYRCFGNDGSKIILPKNGEIEQTFGKTKIKNQYGEGKYHVGLYVCCYDVLNRLAYKNALVHSASYEANVSLNLIQDMSQRDHLHIFDRGFFSYETLATLTKRGQNFVVRCPRKSFKCLNPIFENEGKWSQVKTLHVPKDQRKNIKDKNLEETIKVRFVRVILPTGEIEILATSLMDESLTARDFQDLYHLRWGVEDFFKVLKSRLNLENFTGHSVEAVRQDFWSTIFISNYETIMTMDVEKEINHEKPDECLEIKINKAISFNAIKNMAFELLFDEEPAEETVEKLTRLFKTNTLVVRKNRIVERKKPSPRRTCNFLKRIKKQVF